MDIKSSSVVPSLQQRAQIEASTFFGPRPGSFQRILPLLKRILLELSPTLVLGLTPLLWFHGDKIITGADIDYPLNPAERLRDRTFVWNPILYGGNDRSLDVSTLFFVLVETIPQLLGVDLQTGEKLVFVFWFTLTGIAFYAFMVSLTNDWGATGRYARVIGPPLYMFNFYQFYQWEIVRIGEGAGIILLPSLLALVVAAENRPDLRRKLLLFVPLLAIVCSGIGVQPPVVGIVLLTVTGYVLVLALRATKFSRRDAWLLLRAGMAIVGVFLLTSAFWILPEINFTVRAGYTSSQTGLEVFGARSILEWVSGPTTFDNLFRQYGDIFWTDGFGGEPYIPGIQAYNSNPILKALGYGVPIAAFAVMAIRRDRHTLFLTGLCMFALFASKGIREPFGEWYWWAVQNVPGAWIYRAPWQKFGMVTMLGLSALAALSCGHICQMLARRLQPAFSSPYSRHGSWAVAALIIVGNVALHQPLVAGAMFPDLDERQVLPPLHQSFPPHLFESAEFINTQSGDFRLLTLPDDRTNVYYWGYGGVKDITYDLFRKGIIQRQYGEGIAPPHPLERIQRLFVNYLYNDLTANATDLARIMNAKYVLQRDDFNFGFYGDTDSPQFIRERLQYQGLVDPYAIGPWLFFEIDPLPRLYATTTVVGVGGAPESLHRHLPLGSEGIAFYLDEDVLQFSPQAATAAAAVTTHRLASNQTWLSTRVDDGRLYPFAWPEHSSGVVLEARRYSGEKRVITTGEDAEPDMLSAPPGASPWTFADLDRTYWSAIDSTLVYLKTGNESMAINAILEGESIQTDVVGIWWETGWMGMGTRPLLLPAVVPPHTRAIVQINHLSPGPILLRLSALTPAPTLAEIPRDSNPPTVHFRHVSPVRYDLELSCSTECVLVSLEPYHPQWDLHPGRISVLQALWRRPVADDRHFVANGYANAWTVPAGNHTFTLLYAPQGLFHLGVALSWVATLGVLAFNVDWRRFWNRLRVRRSLH